MNNYGQANPPPPPSTSTRIMPEATFVAPAAVPEGSAIELALTEAHVPGYEGSVTFTYAFDCGSGYGDFGGSPAASCPTVDGPATRTVKGTVKDHDGDATGYTATVQITNVAPTITSLVVPASATLQGGSAQAALSLSFSDPAGAADEPYAATIACGNGSSITGTAGTCSYTAVGSYTVTGRVVDKDGDAGTRSQVLRVVYPFDGFYPPVENLPFVNVIQAGRAVPIKFSLGGDYGLQIFASATPAYPRSQPISCDLGAPTGPPLEGETAGGSSLSYDAQTQQYTYVWKSERAWAGTCREIRFRLNDGTEEHALRFHFTP
jgi:hypothetical protein